MEETERYQRARRRVQVIKEFYIHLIVYVIVNVGLFLINILTWAGHWWFFWPLLGWGIGLVVHAIVVFGIGQWFGNDWEERAIRQIGAKETKA